jgi:thiamine biosynthesis protein ThiS
MDVIINSERRSLAAARTIAELVSELQLVPATLLVELNGNALHRHEWDSRTLSDGDKVELVRVVAGG